MPADGRRLANTPNGLPWLLAQLLRPLGMEWRLVFFFKMFRGEGLVSHITVAFVVTISIR